MSVPCSFLASYLMKNYKKIRKYYAEIDADLVMITTKLFEGFDEILNNCVVPFYASVQNIEGAGAIKKINEQLQEAHKNIMKETQKEEFEIKRVHAELMKFIRTCQIALEKIRASNQTVMTNLQQQMSMAH